ncbi:type IV toxin-antitoxin system AbiEi family antitoxin domain-containing protein [Micromonospora sp. NPDC051006]|uniref:type IV toxin-antitoxin system AbiEi family antitoxin domain-containing protein n=1 Tax=Micromonospora sp. NPDC051006 TaxID=3364283 RepID=UPI0037AEAC97
MPLGMLPATFSYSQALEAGLSEWHLYRLRDQGLIEPVGRGLYRRHDAEMADIDLIEVAHRAPPATLCLTTALARHDLTDEIPSRIDVALPRGRHRPTTSALVAWHLFDPATFEIGRTELPLDPDTSIGLYSPERSIIDAVRLRHREGPELAYAALRRWLRRRDASPSKLLTMARRFPKAERPLREALEILL